MTHLRGGQMFSLSPFLEEKSIHAEYDSPYLWMRFAWLTDTIGITLPCVPHSLDSCAFSIVASKLSVVGAGHLQMHTWEIIRSLLIPTCGCLTYVILNLIIFKTWLRNAKVNAGMQWRARRLEFQLPLPESHLRLCCCSELGQERQGAVAQPAG